MKKGDIVRFKESVDPGDETLLMALLEDPDGGRVKVMALVDMTIKPTYVYPIEDLLYVCGKDDVERLAPKGESQRPKPS